MLQLDAIRFRQDGWHLAADLSVAAGSRVAVLGPSGAGKSTLLSLIAGFLRPTSGRVLWCGQDLTDHAPGSRPVSILFQDNNLFPHLDLRRNLGLGLNPGLRLVAGDWVRVDQALDETGLSGLGDRLPGSLSGGQVARAALARALLRERSILLLDEPFAALGPGQRREMMRLVARILERTGATLLMVTHDPADALTLCPLTILVAEGQAQAPVPTAPLLDDPPPALADYLGRRPDDDADRVPPVSSSS